MNNSPNRREPSEPIQNFTQFLSKPRPEQKAPINHACVSDHNERPVRSDTITAGTPTPYLRCNVLSIHLQGNRHDRQACTASIRSIIPTSLPSSTTEILPTFSSSIVSMASETDVAGEIVYAGVLMTLSTRGDCFALVPPSSSNPILANPADDVIPCDNSDHRPLWGCDRQSCII